MTATTPEAIDQISAIAAQALAAFPDLVVQWDGVDSLDPPKANKDWVRFSIQHEDGGQSSLSGPINGVTRWGQVGVITAQCFGRMDVGGKDRAMQIACALRNAYRGRATAGGVWFRRHTIREVGLDKSWYQVNAFIFFEYDEAQSHVP